MREFEITRARKSDAEALAALEAVCFPPEEAATLAGFEARLDAFGDWFFVAKTPDGEIIGMIDGMATDEESIADEMFEDASLHQTEWAGADGLRAGRAAPVAAQRRCRRADGRVCRGGEAGREGEGDADLQKAAHRHVRAFRFLSDRPGAQ